MRVFEITVEGRTPLLQKRKMPEVISRDELPPGHPLLSIIKGKAITAQDLKRREVQVMLADLGAYKNGHGVYMPAICWRHSFLEGARKGKVKHGRGSIWTLLQGTLFPAPAEPLITRGGKELPDYDNLKESWPRSLSGLVRQFQAEVSLPWTCDLKLLVMDDNFTEPQLSEVVQGGGLYAGVGAWVSGGFGRYELTNREEADVPPQKEMMELMQPA